MNTVLYALVITASVVSVAVMSAIAGYNYATFKFYSKLAAVFRDLSDWWGNPPKEDKNTNDWWLGAYNYSWVVRKAMYDHQLVRTDPGDPDKTY